MMLSGQLPGVVGLHTVRTVSYLRRTSIKTLHLLNYASITVMMCEKGQGCKSEARLDRAQKEGEECLRASDSLATD